MTRFLLKHPIACLWIVCVLLALRPMVRYYDAEINRTYHPEIQDREHKINVVYSVAVSVIGGPVTLVGIAIHDWINQ